MAITLQNTRSRIIRMRGWPRFTSNWRTQSSTKTRINRKPTYDKTICPTSPPSHEDTYIRPLLRIETHSHLYQPVLDLDTGLGIISPLDLEAPGAASCALVPTAEEHRLSDSELDDAPDSDSDISVYASRFPGHWEQFATAEPSPLSLGSSLLLTDTDDYETSAMDAPPHSHALSFKDVFLRAVPDSLRCVLDEASTSHDPYSHSFDIVLGKRPAGEPIPVVPVDPHERIWHAEDQIRSLSVIIAESVGGDNAGKMIIAVQFLLWVLEWAHKYTHTLEELCISLPPSFPIKLCETMDGSERWEVLSKLNTLTWAGDINPLHTVLSRLVPRSLHVLKVCNETLDLDDALLLVRRISTYEIYALELGTLNNASSTPSLFSENGRTIPMLPLCLPYLDSLKISSSTPLDRFFSAISLPPSLCKLEFDVTSVRAGVLDEAIASLMGSEGLLGEHTLFLDIVINNSFGGVEPAMKLLKCIKEKATFAYISIRGT